MPSDKKTVYTDLVDASTSVIDQLFGRVAHFFR